MDIESSQQVKKTDSLSFSDFFDRNASSIDTDDNGVFSHQELANAFKAKYLSHKDADMLDGMFSNFDKISELDHWWISISKEDLKELDERIIDDRKTMKDANRAVSYLEKNYDVLVRDGKKGIYPDDIKTRLRCSSDTSEREILNFLLDNFKEIGNCSGDEWFWEKRRISRKDIGEYESGLSDGLVNSVRFFSGDNPGWIPGKVSFERRRLESAVKNLGNSTETDRAELREIGNAMIEGDLDRLVEAVRSVQPPSRLDKYADALNKRFDVTVDHVGHKDAYKVHTYYKASDSYSSGKPALIFGLPGSFWLHIPADADTKPSAWFEETKGLFKRTTTQRRQPPELVVRYLSSDITDPERIDDHHMLPSPPPV